MARKRTARGPVAEVLITGGAGNVGRQLRSEFAGRYKLRLSDKRLLRPSAGETFVQADIVELSDVLTISEGTDTNRTLNVQIARVAMIALTTVGLT